MITLQATVLLATCALTLAYPVSYITNPEQGLPQQQRLPAGPPPPQYRYVQQQPQQPIYQQQPAEPIYRQQAQPQQQQQVVYQQQPQQPLAQRPRKLRPVAAPIGRVPIGADGNPSSLQDQEYDANPSPYQFSFDVRDDLNTNYQNRKEQREGDKITGSYSVVDSDGFIRTVKYTADPLEGFKAEVTREPTDIKVIIPTAPPPQQQQSVRQQQTQQYLEGASQFQQPQQYVRRPAPQAPRVQQVRQQYAEPAEAQQQYAVSAPAKTAAYYSPQQQQQQQQQYQGYQQ